MKIYTKTGDKGYTSLIGGKRVLKTHRRIEAYGAVDELNSWIGLIADQDISVMHKTVLEMIQNDLFLIGCNLASPTQNIAEKYCLIKKDNVAILEKTMDKMCETLPELHTFVLPGGGSIASYCQIARTVCRRAERSILRLKENERYTTDLAFINRLSDYLFVLARTLICEMGGAERFCESLGKKK